MVCPLTLALVSTPKHIQGVNWVCNVDLVLIRALSRKGVGCSEQLFLSHGAGLNGVKNAFRRAFSVVLV